MNILFKLPFFAIVITQLILNTRSTFAEVLVLLMIAAINIIQWKYNDSLYTLLIEMALIGAAALMVNFWFVLFLGIISYDLVYKRVYAGLVLTLGLGAYLLDTQSSLQYLLLAGTCSCLALADRKLAEKETLFRNTYDKERLYRYELEQIKQKLLNSSNEIAHIAEIRERNRIAGEIHDSIGHNIAGILMQLQASRKLADRNSEKSMELLDKSVDALSDTLVLLRDTVHNIKPREVLGIEYIKNVIENFKFCQVNFDTHGDFNTLPAHYIEVLCSNIKEALTNASKYSKATIVDIKIDVNPRYVRLWIKDNGIGCARVKEGMGLGGMRERVGNMGGSLSVSSVEGFMIVCVIPGVTSEGGVVDEGIGG